jgi:hypothetical protein
LALQKTPFLTLVHQKYRFYKPRNQDWYSKNGETPGALEVTEQTIQVLEKLADNLPEPQRTEFAETTIRLRAKAKDLFLLGIGELIELKREEEKSHA